VASRAKGVARRQTIITAVLLIVGALLALALFAAGALWRGKSSGLGFRINSKVSHIRNLYVPPIEKLVGRQSQRPASGGFWVVRSYD
jgi:hypothetical protein